MSTASSAYAPNSSSSSYASPEAPVWSPIVPPIPSAISVDPNRHTGVDEFSAETLQTGPDPTLHRALGLAQSLGDLLVRQTAKVREFDRIALALLQGFHGLSHVSGERQIPHLVRHVVSAVGLLASFPFLTGAP